MPISEKISKDLNTLIILNNLWEKSIDKEKTNDEIVEFAKANLYIVNDILEQILPEYQKLLDKENLSSSEEWLLIDIKELLNHLTFFVSNIKGILSFYLPFNINEEMKEVLKEIHKLHLYLSDLTGLLPKKDEEIEKQIKNSLKEKEEGNIRDLDEVLKELGI